MDKSSRPSAPSSSKPGTQPNRTPEKGAETVVQPSDHSGDAVAVNDVESGWDFGTVNLRCEWRRLDASNFLREYPDRDTAAFQSMFADWLVDWWPPFASVSRFGHRDVLKGQLDQLKARRVWDQVAELNRLLAGVGLGPLPEEQVGFDFKYDNPPPIKGIGDKLLSQELCEDLIPGFVTKHPEFIPSVPTTDTEKPTQDGKTHPLGVLGLRLFVRHLTTRDSYGRELLLGLPDSRARRSVLKLLVEVDSRGLLQTCWRADQPVLVHESEFLTELKALAAVNPEAAIEFVDQCCERLKSIYADGSLWKVKSVGVACAPVLYGTSRNPTGVTQKKMLQVIQSQAGVDVKKVSTNTTEVQLRRAGILVPRVKKSSLTLGSESFLGVRLDKWFPVSGAGKTNGAASSWHL